MSKKSVVDFRSPSGVTKEWFEDSHGSTCAKKFDFLTSNPKFIVHSGSFGRIKVYFRFDEKVMVFIHSLPLFDYK